MLADLSGELVLGAPKSRAGRRVVGIPAAIIPLLQEHLAVYVAPAPGALLFTGVKGGPLRRSNFNKMSAWPHAVARSAPKACISAICATPGITLRR